MRQQQNLATLVLGMKRYLFSVGYSRKIHAIPQSNEGSIDVCNHLVLPNAYLQRDSQDSKILVLAERG